MSARDPELTRILVQELERHLVVLDALAAQGADAPVDPAIRTLHALKGSAGLAGEPELAASMQRLERRLRDGDGAALAEAASSVRRAAARLSSGEAAASAWPTPPEDLTPGRIDPSVRAPYMAEVADRLAALDEAIARGAASPVAAADDAYRHVHTLKGAASAASDEPMAWFCHGLEERLARARGAPGAAETALDEVDRWRAMLGTLASDPEAALGALRGDASPRPPLAEVRAPGGGARPEADLRGGVNGTIRVSEQSVDRLLDHATGIAGARERVSARVVGATDRARTLRRVRADLVEALRLIGPPRPWGAPAAALRRIDHAAEALAHMSDDLDVVAERIKASDQALKDDVLATRRILTTMRQTPIRAMFSRLAAAAHVEARRTGRALTVRTEGGDELVDRRIVEALFEPCLQLARNAIAHGIEAPEAREVLGKPREATLTLAAARSGSRLSVRVADDGAGVDVAEVRARAVEAGVVTEVLAEAADDQTLLELLFLPGFSTREQSPDLLAGRGIGLDITLARVQRLGGSIRLASRHGRGFEARVDVPIESGLVTVLWVTSEGDELAIPAANARRVRRAGASAEHERVPHLKACLEPRGASAPAFVVELEALDGGEPFGVGVDAVGVTEEVLVRRLSPLLWGIGPYAGAIIRGDGSIRLALDVHALGPRARALGRVPEGHISDPPARRAP